MNKKYLLGGLTSESTPYKLRVMNWVDIFESPDGKIPKDSGPIFLDINMFDIPETMIKAYKNIQKHHLQVKYVSMVTDTEKIELNRKI